MARCYGSEDRPDNGEVDRRGAAVPDASLTDAQVRKLPTMSIQDVTAQHVQGNVLLLAGRADLGDPVPAVGGHPVPHELIKARQQPPAGGWTKTFTDPRLCSAIVDRLTYNGAIIETGTDSYRLAQTRARAEHNVG